MPLFQFSKSGSRQIKEKPFSLEKDLQKFTEENLEAIFGLEFIKSEFELHGLRIDTLAFDRQTMSFVIIEYKRDRNFGVVDQGFAYLSLMLNNKADFILEYGERNGKNIRREDVDWSQSRVYFLARSFTNYQQKAINFKDFHIELWEVTRFENDSVLYNQVKIDNAVVSIKGVAKNTQAQAVSREVKNYEEADVIIKGAKSEELYKKLKEKMTLIDPTLITNAAKLYIAFRLPNNWRNIITVWFRKDKLQIELLRSKPDDYKDPEKRIIYRESSLKHYNQHVSIIYASNDHEIEYAAYIIQQLYDRFIKEEV